MSPGGVISKNVIGPSSTAVVRTIASRAIASDCLCSANGCFTMPAFEWRGICGTCHGTIATHRWQNVQHHDPPLGIPHQPLQCVLEVAQTPIMINFPMILGVVNLGKRHIDGKFPLVPL